ncbi:hypothetical protein CNMCM5623_009076 [Aspergillus felis]|uniref:BTB domain-containing protein n=1 Tax=Aspergillus felis TaxID=1287682 RepID=A0A8H6VA38_9EURO|nr:hypothetical protein CNMCM5623_009076 [Aspergillus felis]KAF7179435.1 hypothetical protein CNMCM7691_008368 [Aspergillus felis]
MGRKRDENEEALIERAQKRMLELIYKLNQQGEFFDFTFAIQDEQFYVSKIVLSAVSPYFRNKFETEWRFKSSVDLEGKHSPNAFSCMIQYIYTYSYEQDIWWLRFTPVQLVKFLFEVYHLAEEYEIPGLKEQELGKVFVAAVADNVQDMQAFEDLDGEKLYLVKTPVFAADLISELIKRRFPDCESSNW